MKNTNIHYKSKPIILIVDDTQTGRHALMSALGEKEYELALATNGQEALALATKLEPDLILLDVMMPGLNGYDVCRQIRSIPPLQEVPILMITSLTEKSERLQGILAGADDFISKPFDAVELTARVRTITDLNRYRKLNAMRRNLAILENQQLHWKKLALVDDLTTLHNRRAFLRKGRDELERARRYQTDLSALMIDVDKFKNVNDTLGHRVGSDILKSVAVGLKKNLRSMDIAGRLGGDEFCILLPHTSLRSAGVLAERLRVSIEAKVFPTKEMDIQVTISIGIATLSPDMNSILDLMEAADQALYKAKTRRNAVS